MLPSWSKHIAESQGSIGLWWQVGMSINVLWGCSLWWILSVPRLPAQLSSM